MLEVLHAGEVFHGRYEVVRCIKAGGMGTVYEVVHLETKRHRALKVMLPSIVRDEGMRNRFRMEAQITADVESDHIEVFLVGGRTVNRWPRGGGLSVRSAEIAEAPS